ncbi:MAG: hypothetical protein Q6J18_04640, partial [Gloeomargarita sp. DG02_3_bins_56]
MMRLVWPLGLSTLGLTLALPVLAQTGTARGGLSLIGVLTLALFTLFILVIILVLLSQIIYICNPNEILIFSGREHRL